MCLSGGAAVRAPTFRILDCWPVRDRRELSNLGAGCAPCQMASSIDNDLWMVALNVVAAIGYADVTGAREIRSDLVLHVCSQGTGCRRLAQRPARARENDSWKILGSGTGVNLLACSGA